MDWTSKLKLVRLDASPVAEEPRKILHLDMDAFYASVEQRDDPALRGRPVVVAWRGSRSVVCAASYEARAYGIRSAMPTVRAERLCPQAIFVSPDFDRYRSASEQIREIFYRHTDMVEPLSLDEAYLDVTVTKTGAASATATARAVRAEILEATGLTASAGIASSKYLAKIASDWRKPDGLFVIHPSRADAFLHPLPVGRLPGVGQVTGQKLSELKIITCGDLRAFSADALEKQFGRLGRRLHELSRGVDRSPVVSHRPTSQISAEDTFPTDLPLWELEPQIRRVASNTWIRYQAEMLRSPNRFARTAFLKLKTADFEMINRSLTFDSGPESLSGLMDTVCTLVGKVNRPEHTRYRLIGVGLANFQQAEDVVQHDLFPASGYIRPDA